MLRVADSGDPSADSTKAKIYKTRDPKKYVFIENKNITVWKQSNIKAKNVGSRSGIVGYA